MKIFVIDDDPMFAEMLKFQLMDFGEVAVFETAEAASDQMNQEPTVILMDYNLDAEGGGAYSGKKAYDFLKNQKGCPPVVFMSSSKNLDIDYTIYVVKDDVVEKWQRVCDQLGI